MGQEPVATEILMILLDGYNVIHANPDLQRFMHSGNLEQAREELVRRIAVFRFTGNWGAPAIVFDGDKGLPNGTLPGVRIQFSRSPQKADELIERLLANSRTRKNLVISSDRKVQHYARLHGADYWSASEFWAGVTVNKETGIPPEKPEDVEDVDEMMERFQKRRPESPWDPE